VSANYVKSLTWSNDYVVEIRRLSFDFGSEERLGFMPVQVGTIAYCGGVCIPSIDDRKSKVVFPTIIAQEMRCDRLYKYLGPMRSGELVLGEAELPIPRRPEFVGRISQREGEPGDSYGGKGGNGGAAVTEEMKAAFSVESDSYGRLGDDVEIFLKGLICFFVLIVAEAFLKRDLSRNNPND
jgi:hypothetical protein